MNTLKKDLKDSLKGMPKIISIIVLIFIVVGVITGLVIWYLDKKTTDENNKIFVGVKYDDVEKCSPEYPLAILVSNGSNKTISSVDVTIKITKKGYSTDISFSPLYILDRIVPPEKSYIQCVKYSLDPAYEQYNKPEGLDFSTVSKYINFQE